ncbi:flagellar hook-associated protein FlgL [Brevibacillus borstelensis]|uniref:flagellar hook-associated protein FlgL n=1 Tax=Brevibacillus borstelensis TaxID=45462 RepID=UPI0014908677|nr:flagellar hook-associated protein FlgL [Brevibacillus borstelensis]NOU58032.1 flagellar hook-associated protein FlgL [Brevibacillus borstelensis]
MAIRVTQTMLNNNMLRNLSNSMGSMDKYQQQLSSGKKINRPSDDPVVATRAMFYRSSLIQNEQFQRNVGEAQSWLEVSDNSLNEAGQIMQRLRELAVHSGDGALEKDSLQAMAKEIAQIRDHMGNIANQTVGGRYIFAGTDTTNPPFSDGKFTNTNTDEIVLEVNKGIRLPVNVLGTEIFSFKGKDGNDIFGLLDSIVKDLEEGKPVNDRLASIDEQIDNQLAVRATLGARMNRIELIKGRLESEEVNVTMLMSENEDADIAEVITQLKAQENVHRAALGAGSRIIQPSLVDFLR